jgi:hypothetical protein
MVYVAKSSQQGGAAKEALRERTIWSALPLAGCWVQAPDGPCGADGGGGAAGTDGGAWNTKATGVKNRPFAEYAEEHQNCLVRKVVPIPNTTPKTFYKSLI